MKRGSRTGRRGKARPPKPSATTVSVAAQARAPEEWVERSGLQVKYARPSYGRASLVAQTVMNPPAMRQTWVRPPGWEVSLEEGMAIHSSILA